MDAARPEIVLEDRGFLEKGAQSTTMNPWVALAWAPSVPLTTTVMVKRCPIESALGLTRIVLGPLIVWSITGVVVKPPQQQAGLRGERHCHGDAGPEGAVTIDEWPYDCELHQHGDAGHSGDVCAVIAHQQGCGQRTQSDQREQCP